MPHTPPPGQRELKMADYVPVAGCGDPGEFPAFKRWLGPRPRRARYDFSQAGYHSAQNHNLPTENLPVSRITGMLARILTIQHHGT